MTVSYNPGFLFITKLSGRSFPVTGNKSGVKKILLLILAAALLLSSCSSTQQGQNASPSDDFAVQINRIFDEYEALEGQVFIGISGPFTNQMKAVQEATENAYYMALLYEDLVMRVDISIDVNTARQRDSFRTYSDAVYDPDRLAEVASRLEIADVQWVGGDVGAVVLAQYADQDNRDKSGDYVYADGTIFTYYYIQDSMFAAAYEAAVNLAIGQSDLSAVVDHTTTHNENMTRQAWQINLSDLNGFEIVSYSYNPETREYTCTARALKRN